MLGTKGWLLHEESLLLSLMPTIFGTLPNSEISAIVCENDLMLQ